MFSVSVLDVLAGKQVNLWALYGILIGLATWNLGRFPGLLSALLATVLMVGSDVFFGHIYSNLGYLVWATFSIVVAFFSLVFLLGALRNKEVQRVYFPPKSRGGL